MITVQILEDEDTIEPTDWCRPLSIISMGGGTSDYYSFKSEYSGTPENNAKWVQAKHVLGTCWFGKTVSEYNTTGPRYEFLRGDILKSHQLNMKGYVSLANLQKG